MDNEKLEDNEVLDMFTLLGIEPEEKFKEKQVKSVSRKGKTKKEKKESYKLPLTVYTGYREPLVITSDKVEEKAELTTDEILKYLETNYKEFVASAVELEIDSKDKSILYVGFKKILLNSKGNVKLNKSSKFILANMDLDLSTLMSDEDCEVDVVALTTLFADTSKVISEAGIIKASKDIIVPSFGLPVLKEENLSFPINIYIFGRDKFSITEEDYLSFTNDDSKEVDKKTIISKGIVESIIVSKFPDFGDGHLELQYNKEHKIVVPCMKMKDVAGPKKPSVTLYPTVDTKISLIFTQLPLSPEQFDGKEEVEEKDIVEFLSRIYPEYTTERTSLLFDKENNLIIPLLKGSTKGAYVQLQEVITRRKEFDHLIDLKQIDYALFNYQISRGRIFRVESTKISLTIAPVVENLGLLGTYCYRLPLIPGEFFRIAYNFFKCVAERYGTEVMLRLYYDAEKKLYVYDLPYQIVGPSSVKAKYSNDVQLNHNMYHIADFHSHCKYDAFFSNIDNADEKGNRIYGVFGPFGLEGKDTDFLLRAGTGGYYTSIKIEDIFDMNQLSIDEVDCSCKRMLLQVPSKITFVNR